MESDTLLGSSQTQPRNERKCACTCCELLYQGASYLKRTAIALYYAVQDPRAGWGCKIVVTLAIMLGITPIDFMPLEGEIAALFDLIVLPLLIFLSLKLVPTDVMEDARHQATSTGFNLFPLKSHWKLALLTYVFWTVQLAINARVVLPKVLRFFGFSSASNWTLRHKLLLMFIFLAIFNLKCLIVVVWCLWKEKKLAKEGRLRLEASLITNASSDPLASAASFHSCGAGESSDEESRKGLSAPLVNGASRSPGEGLGRGQGDVEVGRH